MHEFGYFTPMIIADGGIRDYVDVIRALALGADYVMIGGLFSKLVESSATTFYYDANGQKKYISPFMHKILSYPNGVFRIDENETTDNLHKIFYGMASRKGQEDINGCKNKTSEGIEKIFDCTTNMCKWKENMVGYLQTAMSYTNCLSIDDFNPENVNCITTNSKFITYKIQIISFIL